MKIQRFVEHGDEDHIVFYRAAGSVLLWCLVEIQVDAYYKHVLQF